MFHVAPYCMLMLQFVQAALYSYFSFFISQCFHHDLFSRCNFFMSHLFSCCNVFMLYISWTIFMLHLFPCWVLPCFTIFLSHIFSCSTLFMLHFFQFGHSLLTCFLFCSFRVPFFAAAFSLNANFSHCILPCRTRFMLHLFSLALFSCCTLFKMHSPVAIFHAALTSCCGLLGLYFSFCNLPISDFMLHTFTFMYFLHVALYQVLLSSCFIFWKHLQSTFVLGMN